jgi:hypothetical protein
VKPRPQHRAPPRPVLVKPIERTTPADYLAVMSTPVKANLPAEPAGSAGSQSSHLLVLGAVALVLVAALSMSLLRLLLQASSPRRGW